MKQEIRKDKIKNGEYLAEDLYIGCVSVYDSETNKYKGNYTAILFNYVDDFYYDVASVSDQCIYALDSQDPHKFICYMESINNYINLLKEKLVNNDNESKEFEYLSFTDASIIMGRGAGDDILKKGTMKTITNSLKKTK